MKFCDYLNVLLLGRNNKEKLLVLRENTQLSLGVSPSQFDSSSGSLSVGFPQSPVSTHLMQADGEFIKSIEDLSWQRQQDAFLQSFTW